MAEIFSYSTHFSATYDAWGNQTISTNAIGISRGFPIAIGSGHEHWPQFGLIDMNGRFYDPLLGRFLSPDPYVQMPENPQNFNRYSYCLNNPLKYTDPSGEWILTWAISKCSFSVGVNFAPYPFGFGINIDWSNGLSLGVYGEFGERAGGNGLGAGIYADQGFSYNFKHHEWSTSTSEGTYASLLCFTVGGSFSQTYNFSNNAFSNDWSISAGLGFGNNNSNVGYGIGLSYGSNGWDIGVNGNYVHDNSNHTVASAIVLEPDGNVKDMLHGVNDYNSLTDNAKSEYKTIVDDNPNIVVDDYSVELNLKKKYSSINTIGFDESLKHSNGLGKNSYYFINETSGMLTVPKTVTIFYNRTVGLISPFAKGLYRHHFSYRRTHYNRKPF